MAFRNREYVLKRGEVGSIMTATLYDEDGVVNLTGWSVTVTARQGTSAPVIDDASCTLAADPTTGAVSYEFTNTTANVAAGTYDLEFKGVNPSGDIYYFPKSRNKPFGILRVIESLESA